MNTTSPPQSAVFDRASSDGTLLQRGYLELSLDIQHCAGASAKNDDGSENLTLTLFTCDPATNAYTSTHVFATRVSADASPEVRKKLLARLMDRLVNKHRVSVFADKDDIDPDAITAFGSEVEFATSAWVDE